MTWLTFFASVRKEAIVLFRDWGGLAMIFAMPVVLVVLMSLIQDAPFRDFLEVKVDVGLVDEDKSHFSSFIREQMLAADHFGFHAFPDRETARMAVREGKVKAVILVKDSASEWLDDRVTLMVQEFFVSAGLSEATQSSATGKPVQLVLWVDPVMKQNFRLTVENALQRMAAQWQSKKLVEEVRKQIQGSDIADSSSPSLSFSDAVILKPEYVTDFKDKNIVLNSVQHNVPAWAMFAMFFILFPLAGNFIKEREEGSMLRVRVISGSYRPLVTGKMTLYFFICLIQFLLMLLAGFYLMPLLGLPKLVVGDNLSAILLTSSVVAFAATAYGLLIAIAFRSYHTALMLGSISVVLFAAIGGVLVPGYIMPEWMQSASKISPLNWGLEALNDLFLMNASLWEVGPSLLRLFSFGTFCLGMCFYIATRKRML